MSDQCVDTRPIHFYALQHPISKEIRYVGKTVKTPSKRLAGHVYDALIGVRGQSLNTPLCNWIRKLAGEGLLPEVVLLGVLPHAGDWQAEECRLIAEARLLVGKRLLNVAERGEGAPGVVFTAERRAKIGAIHRGRVHSTEEIEKRRLLLSGRKQSPEQVEKRVSKLRGRRHSEESRSNMANGTREWWEKPEIREHMSKIRKGRKQSVDAVEKRRVALRGQRRSPEARQNMSEAMRGKRKSPLHIASLRASRWGEGYVCEIDRYETAVMEALRGGKTGVQIAKELDISPNTISKIKKRMNATRPPVS